MRFSALFVGLLVSGLVVSSVSAHGDAPSLEAQVGTYFIDIGYEPALASGTPITFDIDLYAADSLAYADFARVDVRITRDGAEIAAASIENDPDTVPSYIATFEQSGGYDMDVRYLDAAGTLLAARTFHLDVPGSARVFVRGGLATAHYAIAAGLLALSIGIGGYSLWERFSKSSGR